MTKRIDVHEEITNRIVDAIEKSPGEFKLPWHRPAGSITRPVNIQSNNPYRGINVVSLWVEAEIRGYATPVWGTYKQFHEAGCQVRKGEKASLAVFYKEIEFEKDLWAFVFRVVDNKRPSAGLHELQVSHRSPSFSGSIIRRLIA